MRTFPIFIFISLMVVACATTPKDRFSSLQVGMHKDGVLDTMGSPVRSDFRKGEYIWTYRVFEGEKSTEKEVRLKNDLVTYVGEAQQLRGDPFDRLKVGMEKAEVLDLLGFPKRVEKREKSEVWVYLDGKSTRSFVVTDGKISSLAAPPVRDTSAKSDGFVPVEDEPQNP